VGTIIALTLFSWHGGNSPDRDAVIVGQTMVFNFVVLYEVILSFVIRRDYQVPLFSNKWVWVAAVFALSLQAVLMYTPMHSVFKIAALQGDELVPLLGGGALFFVCAVFYQSVMAKKMRQAASFTKLPEILK
jgi:Ca2+-transporting ATPase